MFHMSVAVISLRTPFISEFPPTPLEMMEKISPSLEPYSHSASVRLAGLGLFGASRPSPSPSGPWHCGHALLYVWRPLVIELAVAATGFFIAAAFGLPPLGAWAAPSAADKKIAARRVLTRLRMVLTRKEQDVCLHVTLGECRKTGGTAAIAYRARKTQRESKAHP